MKAADILKAKIVDRFTPAEEILISSMDGVSYTNPDGTPEKIKFHYMSGEELLSIPTNIGTAGSYLAQIKYVLYSRVIDDETGIVLPESTIDWFIQTQPAKARDVSALIRSASWDKLNELNKGVIEAKNDSIRPV